MHQILRLSIICLLTFSTTSVAMAQFAGGGAAGQAELVVSPSYYEPNQEVQVTLDAYSMNTNGATIRWIVDGVEQTAAQDKRAITTTTGDLGTATNVQALVSLPGGGQLPATTTLRPVRIDLLVEADTLTPAFYRGRSLPTSGSAVRVTAIPHTGSNRTPEQYSYSWQVGRDVVGGGTQYGQNSVTFTPEFSTAIPVQVTVFDQSGNQLTGRSITVPIVEPELHFYEINPLRGLQTRALSSNQIFQGTEMQVRAEPYYISRGMQTDDFHTEWKLNGRTINNPSRDPQQISLRRDGNSGTFTLEFHMRNLNQLLQGVKDTITVRF